MRTADRHTVPPGDPQAGPTARPTRILPCRPDNRRPPCDQPHLAAPAIAACHADQPTLQTRQPPPAMRPASPCSPGNRRPPCDQPTLQTRQPPPAMRPAPPCRPGNRRPPVMPPFLHTDPTAAARRRRSLVKQTVVPRSRPCRPPPQPKGIEGHPEGPAVGRGVAEGRGSRGKGLQREGVAEGRGRGGEGLQREGVAEGRDYGREGCNRKARSRIRHGPAESLAEFFHGLCTICKPKYTF